MNTPDEAPRWLLAVVAAAHGAALFALAAPAVRSFAPPRPLAVALVAPPASGAAPAAQAEPLRRLPAPVQPRPQPAAVRSASPAAAASAPTQVQSPAPASSVPASPAPTTALAALAASAAAAHPAPIQPPRFDAAYLNNPPPPYPPLARRLGEEGKTVLRVYVSAEGLPGQIELLESAGSPRIDEAALEAVKHWRFVPARQGELAIAAWVRVPISFRLENR